LEIRKRFLPLQTQTEGSLREQKKLRLSEFGQEEKKKDESGSE